MRFSSVVATFTSLAAVGAVSLFASPAQAQITGLFSTGVAANNTPLVSGATDTHYTFITGTGSTPAIVTNLQAPSPYASIPNARYIWNNADGSLVGQYILRTTFTLTGSATGASLSGTYSTDNNGFIRLNGTQVGPSSSGFLTPTNFTLTSNFVTGVNTLDFVVTNTDGPGALAVGNLVGTTASAAAPEPGSLALLIPAGLGVVGMVRRRRK